MMFPGPRVPVSVRLREAEENTRVLGLFSSSTPLTTLYNVM